MNKEDAVKIIKEIFARKNSESKAVKAYRSPLTPGSNASTLHLRTSSSATETINANAYLDIWSIDEYGMDMPNEGLFGYGEGIIISIAATLDFYGAISAAGLSLQELTSVELEMTPDYDCFSGDYSIYAVYGDNIEYVDTLSYDGITQTTFNIPLMDIYEVYGNMDFVIVPENGDGYSQFYPADCYINLSHRVYSHRNIKQADYGQNPKINLASGRLIYEHEDISVGGGSYATGVSHIYNSALLVFLEYLWLVE